MTTSLYSPDLVVEIAFDSGVMTPAASRTWTDVSAYVEFDEGVTIRHGRQDESSPADADTLSLVLDNSDGRFTPERAASPYYPNVLIGRPIRVRATYDAVTYDRFTGYVDEWPVAWDGGEDVSMVTVTATSRLARLAAGAELRSALEEAALVPGPVAYYPLTEPEGATRAANIAERAQPDLVQFGTGTTVAFGTGTGPSTDEAPAAMFYSGRVLSAELDLTAVGSGDAAASFWFASTDNDTEALWFGSMLFWVEAGEFRGALSGTSVAVSGIMDGATHHVVGSYDAVADVFTLYVDGTSRGTLSGAFAYWTTSGTPSVVIGGGADLKGSSSTDTDDPFTGTISHVALYRTALSASEVTAIYEAGTTLHVTDTPAERLTRLASFADVPAAELDLDTGQTPSLSPLSSRGATVTGLMSDLAHTTESGILHDGRDGTLVFRDRAHRYQSTAVLSLDVSAQEVESNLEPTYDRSTLVNDATATNASGVSARSTDADSATEYGWARTSFDLGTTDPDEPALAASWVVSRYAVPKSRIRTLDVRPLVLTTAKAAALLALDVSDRIELTGLPSQAPATTVDYFVEGYTETWALEDWQLSLNVSPAVISDVFILDDATYGVLDANILAY